MMTPARARQVHDMLYASLVMGVAVALMLFLVGSTDIITSLTIIGILLCLSLVGSALRFLTLSRTDADLRAAQESLDQNLKILQHRVGDHDLILLQMAGQLETLETGVSTLRQTQNVQHQASEKFTRTVKEKILALVNALASARVDARLRRMAPAPIMRRTTNTKSFFTPVLPLANDTERGVPTPLATPHTATDDDVFVSPNLMREAIETALSQNRVDTYVQPICTLPQRRVFGYSISGRIRLQPGVYIPARQYRGHATHDGTMVRLDRLVLTTIPGLTKILSTEKVFINLAATALRDNATIDAITHLARAMAGIKGRVIVELSQNDFNRLDDKTEQVINALQTAGVGFGVNDVANPEIDLNKLAHLKFNYLKLPYARVITTQNSDQGAAILHRLITRLQTRNIQLIVGKLFGSYKNILSPMIVQLQMHRQYDSTLWFLILLLIP